MFFWYTIVINQPTWFPYRHSRHSYFLFKSFTVNLTNQSLVSPVELESYTRAPLVDRWRWPAPSHVGQVVEAQRGALGHRCHPWRLGVVMGEWFMTDKDGANDGGCGDVYTDVYACLFLHGWFMLIYVFVDVYTIISLVYTELRFILIDTGETMVWNAHDSQTSQTWSDNGALTAWLTQNDRGWLWFTVINNIHAVVRSGMYLVGTDGRQQSSNDKHVDLSRNRGFG